MKLARQMKITPVMDSYGARFKSCLSQPGTVWFHLSAPRVLVSVMRMMMSAPQDCNSELRGGMELSR